MRRARPLDTLDPLVGSAYEHMVSGAAFLAAPPHLGPDAAARLAGRLAPGHLGVFSSGSVGAARCITRTWASWLDSFPAIETHLGVEPDEIVALPGPGHSTMVLFAALHALHQGAIPVIGPDADGPQGRAAAVIHAVPTAARTILDEIDDGARAVPRLLVTAGARAPRDLWERCHRHGISMVEYYGAAETSFIAWHREPGPLAAIPGVDIDIRDGLIWVRSPFVAEGYLEDGVDNARGPRGPMLTDGAWVSVGDRGDLDGAGRLTVQGRVDTAVTTAGHTVLVDDVEAVLADVPGVREVVVVGVPHEHLGEVMVAVVVGSASTADLRRAAEALPPPARPRSWIHRDELPRLPGGKPDRERIRAEAAR